MEGAKSTASPTPQHMPSSRITTGLAPGWPHALPPLPRTSHTTVYRGCTSLQKAGRSPEGVTQHPVPTRDGGASGLSISEQPPSSPKPEVSLGTSGKG